MKAQRGDSDETHWLIELFRRIGETIGLSPQERADAQRSIESKVAKNRGTSPTDPQ